MLYLLLCVLFAPIKQNITPDSIKNMVKLLKIILNPQKFFIFLSVLMRKNLLLKQYGNYVGRKAIKPAGLRL